MLAMYDCVGTRLVPNVSIETLSDATVWIDLLNPTPEEDANTEKALGISIPTRDEMREIEASSRLYTEHGAYYMTTFIVTKMDSAMPETAAVTFILSDHRLVTVRYAEPAAFPLFLQRVENGDASCGNGTALMIGLIETIIHRKADLIERVQDDVDRTAHALFSLSASQRRRKDRKLEVYIRSIGKQGDIVARFQESAMAMDRLLVYFQDAVRARKEDGRITERIEVAQRDIAALLENMRFLSNRTAFLLNATLGMISTEQNQIIKLFSVMAVMLMPPTLVASIYGMNFQYMPELAWPIGYPLAIILMVVSGVVPYVYFRGKGWM